MDLQLALRRLRRDLYVVGAAVGCIACGVAGTIAVVRIADALWFGAPPGTTSPSLLRRILVESDAAVSARYAPYASHTALTNIRQALGAEEQIAEMHEQELVVRVGQSSLRRVDGALVSTNFFRTVGVGMAAGRAFVSGDNSPVCVISSRFAIDVFERQETAVGRVLKIGGQLYTVTGVLAPGFLGTEVQPIDVWLSVDLSGGEYFPQEWRTDMDATLFRGFVRLSRAADQRGFETAATTIYRRLVGPSLTAMTPPEVVTTPLAIGRNPVRSPDAALSRLVVLLSILVWLAVCTNVAGLILVRAIARNHESLLVLTFGASPWRLLRGFLIEIVAITALGFAVGMLVAAKLSSLLAAMGLVRAVATYQSNVTHIISASVALALTVIVAGVGMAARDGGRLDLASGLTTLSRNVTNARLRVQRSVLIIQITLGTALLYLTGLFVASFQKAKATPLGFQPDNVYLVSASTGAAGYSIAETDRLFRDLADRARALPGVSEASVGVSVPFLINLGTRVRIPEGDGHEVGSYIDVVSPHYFKTLHVEMKRGRDFNSTDDALSGVPVAIVSEELARELFGKVDPIGRCILVQGPPCRQVIGVVGDMLQVDLQAHVTHVYLSLDQQPELLPSRTLFVRVASAGSSNGTAIAELRDQLQIHTTGAAISIREMAALAAIEVRPWRLSAYTLTAFSALSMVVLGIGVFGVVSIWVSHWKREVGIRLALGASAIQIIALVLRRVFPALAVGLASGIAAGLIVGRLVAADLFVISPFDFGLAATAIGIPLLSTAAAIVRPVMWLAGMNPVIALRAE